MKTDAQFEQDLHDYLAQFSGRLIGKRRWRCPALADSNKPHNQTLKGGPP
jgi:hypothetical protein